MHSMKVTKNLDEGWLLSLGQSCFNLNPHLAAKFVKSEEKLNALLVCLSLFVFFAVSYYYQPEHKLNIYQYIFSYQNQLNINQIANMKDYQMVYNNSGIK